MSEEAGVAAGVWAVVPGGLLARGWTLVRGDLSFLGWSPGDVGISVMVLGLCAGFVGLGVALIVRVGRWGLSPATTVSMAALAARSRRQAARAHGESLPPATVPGAAAGPVELVRG